MTPLQPSVDLSGNPLGRAHQPLAGNGPAPQAKTKNVSNRTTLATLPNTGAKTKNVSNRTSLATLLNTGTSIQHENEEGVPRVV